MTEASHLDSLEPGEEIKAGLRLRPGGRRGSGGFVPSEKQDTVVIPSSPERVLEVPDCDVANMVRTLNGAIAAVSHDTARIQRAYQHLCTDSIAQDKALADLTAQPHSHMVHRHRPVDLVRRYRRMYWMRMGTYLQLTLASHGRTTKTFLHGVRVVGSKFSRPTGQEPVMSTPYPWEGKDDRSSSSMTTQPPSLETPEFRPEREAHLHRLSPEARQGYRPAAPIQRFNNKSLNWPAWFRHCRAVADVHGWSKEQRELQLVSYLDETAMNVAQELGGQ